MLGVEGVDGVDDEVELGVVDALDEELSLDGALFVSVFADVSA